MKSFSSFFGSVIVACLLAMGAAQAETSKAVFAGGCFWSMQKHFDEVPGVVSTRVGFIGGTVANPTYRQVTYTDTGHAEAIEITYDPAKVSYATLLDSFWHYIDPTAVNGQFCDWGKSYRTGIFYLDADQKRLADESKLALEKSGRFDKPIATEITAATPFYAAENYHQAYYKKNPAHYEAYRVGCGRDRALAKIWKN
jgi:peptide-methionine (S)-S-oxide reductase